MNVADFKIWFAGLTAGTGTEYGLTNDQLRALAEEVKKLEATPAVPALNIPPQPKDTFNIDEILRRQREESDKIKKEFPHPDPFKFPGMDYDSFPKKSPTWFPERTIGDIKLLNNASPVKLYIQDRNETTLEFFDRICQGQSDPELGEDPTSPVMIRH
jgi:hypothetical protein